jgi:hypothetical protein
VLAPVLHIEGAEAIDPNFEFSEVLLKRDFALSAPFGAGVCRNSQGFRQRRRSNAAIGQPPGLQRYAPSCSVCWPEAIMAKPLPLPVWDRQRGKLVQEWMDDHQPHYESDPQGSFTQWIKSQPLYDRLYALYENSRWSTREIDDRTSSSLDLMPPARMRKLAEMNGSRFDCFNERVWPHQDAEGIFMRHGPDVFAGDRGEGIGARRLGCRALSH